MGAPVTIYHNPRCTKSRQTLALLKDRGLDVQVVEYLKEPPSEETLSRILGWLDRGPRDLMRKKEAPYAELGLADAAKTDAELIAAMVAHPILIERPIVVTGERAAIGRPPEQVLEIL